MWESSHLDGVGEERQAKGRRFAAFSRPFQATWRPWPAGNTYCPTPGYRRHHSVSTHHVRPSSPGKTCQSAGISSKPATHQLAQQQLACLGNRISGASPAALRRPLIQVGDPWQAWHPLWSQLVPPICSLFESNQWQTERGFPTLSMPYARILVVHQCNQLLTKHMLFSIAVKHAIRALA